MDLQGPAKGMLLPRDQDSRAWKDLHGQVQPLAIVGRCDPHVLKGPCLGVLVKGLPARWDLCASWVTVGSSVSERVSSPAE